MEYVARIAAALAVVYLAVVALAYFAQRAMTYFPAPRLPAPAEAGLPEMAVVSLHTEDGLDLAAWYAAPNGEAPVILYLHGNAGHIGMRADKIRPYLAAGLGVLLVEYRGYGGNPGRPHEAGLYRDGRAALQFLRDAGMTDDRLVLYGESLGAAVAVELARGRTLRALVLEAPFTSLPDVGAHAYPYLPVRLLARDRYDSLAKIAEVRTPLILVHGEADGIVPVAMGRALLAAANEPKYGLFPAGAGHNDLGGFGIAEWVLDTIGKLRDTRE